MTASFPFSPAYTQGQTVSPGAATANVKIGGGAKQLALTNLGANVVYVRPGTAADVVATANDYPVPPGAQMNISKSEGHEYLAFISPAGTTLHIIPGEGY